MAEIAAVSSPYPPARSAPPSVEEQQRRIEGVRSTRPEGESVQRQADERPEASGDGRAEAPNIREDSGDEAVERNASRSTDQVTLSAAANPGPGTGAPERPAPDAPAEERGNSDGNGRTEAARTLGQVVDLFA